MIYNGISQYQTYFTVHVIEFCLTNSTVHFVICLLNLDLFINLFKLVEQNLTETDV